jgi:hypothetical protein
VSSPELAVSCLFMYCLTDGDCSSVLSMEREGSGVDDCKLCGADKPPDDETIGVRGASSSVVWPAVRGLE